MGSREPGAVVLLLLDLLRDFTRVAFVPTHPQLWHVATRVLAPTSITHGKK